MYFNRETYAVALAEFIPALMFNENVETVFDVEHLARIGCAWSDLCRARFEVRTNIFRKIDFEFALHLRFSGTARVLHH